MNRSKKRLIFVVSMAVSATVAFYINSGSLAISADVWADFLSAILLAGIPALSISSALRHKKERAEHVGSLKRTVVALFIIVLLLSLAAFEVLMAQTGSFDWTGFRLLSLGSFLLWLIALLIGLFGIERAMQLIRTRARLWSSQRSAAVSPKPETASERRFWYFLAAPLIAVMQEFLYRGYLFNEIPSLWDAHPLACAWIVSSLAFGLARVQKDLSRAWGGIATGFLLGCPVVFSGSLFPSMAAQALYNSLGPHVPPYREIAKATATNS